MNIIQNAKEIGELIKKYNDQDLYQRSLDDPDGFSFVSIAKTDTLSIVLLSLPLHFCYR